MKRVVGGQWLVRPTVDCMGFAQHRPCRGQEMDREGSRTRILSSRGSEEGSAAPGGFPTHHEDPRNALPSGQRGRITVPAKHFFSETLRLPGTGIAKMRPEPLCWPILGLCWPICCLCWGPCSPILGSRWGYVATSWPLVGPCCGRCWTVGYPPR